MTSVKFNKIFSIILPEKTSFDWCNKRLCHFLCFELDLVGIAKYLIFETWKEKFNNSFGCGNIDFDRELSHIQHDDEWKAHEPSYETGDKITTLVQ